MADAPKLIDLQYTKAEQKEETNEMAVPSSSQYPWGLCMSLEKRELDKLGITGLPSIGDEWHMLVVAKVTGVNTQSGVDKEDSVRVGLQVTMAQVLMQESAADEDKEAESPEAEAKESAGKILGY